MPNSDNLCLRRQQLFKLVEQKLALVVDRSYAQLCAFFFTQQLPGNNVGMVLQSRDQNFITTTDVLTAIRLRHQVDGFRGAANKDDLFAVSRIQELARRFPNIFIMLRGPFRKRVNAAVNIGIVVAIITFQRFHYRQRLLRGGGVVKINQRLAVYLLVQNRKVFADLVHVKRVRRVDFMRRFDRGTHLTSSQFLAAPSAVRSPINCAASGNAATTSFSMWSRTWVEF